MRQLSKPAQVLVSFGLRIDSVEPNYYARPRVLETRATEPLPSLWLQKDRDRTLSHHSSSFFDVVTPDPSVALPYGQR